MAGRGSGPRVANPHNAVLAKELSALADGFGTGSNQGFAYRRAIQSICRYPLPITSGEDAKALAGIGPHFARQIDSILDRHRAGLLGGAAAGAAGAAGAAPAPQPHSHRAQAAVAGGASDLKHADGGRDAMHADGEDGIILSPSGVRLYNPTFGKGPWILLLAVWCHCKAHGDFTLDVHKDQVERRFKMLLQRLPSMYRNVTYESSSANATRTLVKNTLLAKGSAGYVLTPAGLHVARAAADLPRAAFVHECATLAAGESEHRAAGGGHGTHAHSNHIAAVAAASAASSPKPVAPPPAAPSAAVSPSSLHMSTGPLVDSLLLSDLEVIDRSDDEDGNDDDDADADGMHAPSAKRARTDPDVQLLQHPPDVMRRWDVILLLDNREIRGRSDRSEFEDKLRGLGVNVEVRQLQLGDMLWIVRRKNVPGNPVEFVMSFIVERKNVQDLDRSICDGRYEEQKHRLAQCGLSQVIYLVEGDIADSRLRNAKAVQSAIAETMVHNSFFVHQTNGVDDSLVYLQRLHRQIVALFADDEQCQPHIDSDLECAGDRAAFLDLSGRGGMPTPLATYADFADRMAKSATLNVGQVFSQQLQQIKGCGQAAATAIAAKYTTPAALLAAYDVQPTEQAKRALLAELSLGTRKVGLALSERIYELYCSPSYKS